MQRTKLNNPERMVFGGGVRGRHYLLAEVLEVGWGRFAAADGGHLEAHAHADAFEICVILSGEVEWCTGSSTDVLRAGDVYLTQPGERHWGRDAAMHPCTLYWLILGSCDQGFDWPDCDPELATLLVARLRQLRTHRLRGTAKLAAAIQDVFEEHKSAADSAEDPLLRKGSVRAALRQLLIELVRVSACRATRAPAADLPQATVHAINELHECAHDAHAIRHVCRSTGSDLKRLNRQFIESLGISISQYWLRERIRLARERLVASDVSVTQLSGELGFSSSQHFATAFRKVAGLTPTEYRRRASAEA